MLSTAEFFVDADNTIDLGSLYACQPCYYFGDDSIAFVSRWPDCSLKRNLQATLMYQAHLNLPY